MGNSKKKQAKWGCSHGCDVSKKTCKHIEAKLPQPYRGSLCRETKEAYQYDRMEVNAQGDVQEYERRARKLEAILEDLGMEGFRAELLMDRFVDNMSIAEIVKFRGYTSATTVQRLIKDTVSKIEKVKPAILDAILKEYEE